MSVADLIREEGKRQPSMAKTLYWLSVAKWVEENANSSADLSVDDMAIRLRAHNMRYFPQRIPWEECDDHVKEIWRTKARWVLDYKEGQP